MEHLLISKEQICFVVSNKFLFRILKNTIIQLACRLQLHECIEKATSLWNEAYPALASGSADHPFVSFIVIIII